MMTKKRFTAHRELAWSTLALWLRGSSAIREWYYSDDDDRWLRARLFGELQVKFEFIPSQSDNQGASKMIDFYDEQRGDNWQIKLPLKNREAHTAYAKKTTTTTSKSVWYRRCEGSEGK